MVSVAVMCLLNDAFARFLIVRGASPGQAGDFSEKVKLLFEAFSDGTKAEASIRVSELLEMVKSNTEEFTDVISFTEDTITQLDKDQSGTLSVYVSSMS